MTGWRCRCGHDADLHVHYRAGTDCAMPACRCARFRLRRLPPSRRGLQIGLRAVITVGAVGDLIAYSAGVTPARWEGIVLAAACALLALNPLPPRRLTR